MELVGLIPVVIISIIGRKEKNRSRHRTQNLLEVMISRLSPDQVVQFDIASSKDQSIILATASFISASFLDSARQSSLVRCLSFLSTELKSIIAQTFTQTEARLSQQTAVTPLGGGYP